MTKVQAWTRCNWETQTSSSENWCKGLTRHMYITIKHDKGSSIDSLQLKTSTSFSAKWWKGFTRHSKTSRPILCSSTWKSSILPIKISDHFNILLNWSERHHHKAPRFKFNDLWPKSQTSSNMSTLSGWPHWETLILGRWTGSITNWKLRKLWSDVGLRKRREHWIASQSWLTTRSNHWRTQQTAYSSESRKNEILFNWSFVDHKYCFVSLKKCIRRVEICESMLETKTTNPSTNRLKRSSKETETKFGASNLILVNKSPLKLTL